MKQSTTRACSFFLILVFLSPGIAGLAQHDSAAAFGYGLLLPACLAAVVQGLLGRAWLLALLASPLLLLALPEAVYLTRYHAPVNSDIFLILASTNLNESVEFLGPWLWVGILATAAVAWAVVMMVRHRHRATPWSWRARAVCLALVLGVATVGGPASDLLAGQPVRWQGLPWRMTTTGLDRSYPVGAVMELTAAWHGYSAMRQAAARAQQFRFHVRPAVAVAARQIYVLVIGESAWRSRWQMFGAARPTNPELMRLPGLVPISDMVSSWSSTDHAVPVMLTRKPPQDDVDMPWPEPGIVQLFNEAGFDTWWISNQHSLSNGQSFLGELLGESRHAHWLAANPYLGHPNHDDVLIGAFAQALASSRGNLFVVLHMMGSHAIYDYRYPQAFARFQPVLGPTARGGSQYQRIANSYDNTIVFSDHVLAAIIHILDAQNATSALWYESDHGEDLPTPTCDLAMHGNASPHDFEIAAFAWLSKNYRTRFPDKASALAAHASQPSISADTFDSIADMADLVFDGQRLGRSLFSSRWVPPSWRPVVPVTRMPGDLRVSDYDRAPRKGGCQVLQLLP